MINLTDAPIITISQYSSRNPESPLGYARSFLDGRNGKDFEQEALSLVEAMDDVYGLTDAEVEHTKKVLERLAAMAVS